MKNVVAALDKARPNLPAKPDPKPKDEGGGRTKGVAMAVVPPMKGGDKQKPGSAKSGPGKSKVSTRRHLYP